MTQETTLEDSMRNDTVRSMQSLSPSVRPAGNGCRETTLEDSMRNDTACPLQSLSPSVLQPFALSVVTQEATLEDSTCNDTATSLQSLSPSVRPSANGCRERSELRMLQAL
ncbi:MAG: hypothetical protein QM665_04470 [Desulfovibrio sp.]